MNPFPSGFNTKTKLKKNKPKTKGLRWGSWDVVKGSILPLFMLGGIWDDANTRPYDSEADYMAVLMGHEPLVALRSLIAPLGACQGMSGLQLNGWMRNSIGWAANCRLHASIAHP